MKNHIIKWENKEVKIKILVDCPEIKLYTRKIGPFKKEDELKIPLWIARILKQEKIAEYSESMMYDLENLLKIQWVEQEKQKIQKVEMEFYLKMQETLSNLLYELKVKDDVELKTQIIQKKDKMNMIFKDLYSRRLYKILRAATLPYTQSEFSNSLTNEELELYMRLKNLIKEWESSFIMFNNKNV